MQNTSSSNGGSHLGYGSVISTVSPYVSTLLFYNTATTGLVVTETPTYSFYGNASYTTYTETDTWYPNAYSFSATVSARGIVPITIVATA
jgi:hypothetical protein